MPRKKPTDERPPSALMTVAEVAHGLQVDRATVYRMHDRGELPFVRFGGSTRIPRTAFDALITNRAS